MNELFLPGLEPDFDVKKELRLIGGMPDLHQFDFVFISCSGGKDSHAMAYLLAELADRQKYNKNKMELLYADTGLEWHDTFDQVKRIGQSIGIQAVMVTPKYKLLDNVRRRWAKFNGLEWEDSRAEQSRAEQSRADDPQSGRTEAWRVRSRTLLNGSARAITNDFQSSSMSVSEQQDYVVQKPRETVSNRTLRSQSIRGGGDMWNRPFPSIHARFCTTWGKQEPQYQYIRKSVSNGAQKVLHRRGEEQCDIREGKKSKQSGGWLGEIKILMCTGERREESSRRSKYPEWSIHKNLTTKKRRVYSWRPMLDFKTADIWSVIRESGIEAHEAYQLGCERLGCTMCIFAGDCGRAAKDVKISCRENPVQYEELDKLEMDTGFTMSIQGVRVRDIVKA